MWADARRGGGSCHRWMHAADAGCPTVVVVQRWNVRFGTAFFSAPMDAYCRLLTDVFRLLISCTVDVN